MYDSWESSYPSVTPYCMAMAVSSVPNVSCVPSRRVKETSVIGNVWPLGSPPAKKTTSDECIFSRHFTRIVNKVDIQNNKCKLYVKEKMEGVSLDSTDHG